MAEQQRVHARNNVRLRLDVAADERGDEEDEDDLEHHWDRRPAIIGQLL